MDESIEIRAASRGDLPELLRMMRDFAEFEDLSASLRVDEEKLTDAMFSDDAFVRCLIAWKADRAVGYAIYFPYFASFRGERSVYLEDLYVDEANRRSGLGERLLRSVAGEGKKFGAVRMDFQVLDWNKPAIEFYRRHGAQADPSERHFRFVEHDFSRLSG